MIEALWTLAQTVLNVVLAACIFNLKLRMQKHQDTTDQRMGWLCDRIERMERKT